MFEVPEEAPAFISFPLMIDASFSTLPLLLNTLPLPALNSGESSNILIVSMTANLSSNSLRFCLSASSSAVEIVDLRTIFPLDEEIILKSIEKTSNLVILQEDVPFSSIASEVSSVVAEKGFWNLDNPIIKVTSPNTHIPFAPILEDAFIPSAENLIKAIKELQ